MSSKKNTPASKALRKMGGYEKIRTVGKGAFGTANLYLRQRDQKLVIIKEINMHELSGSERLLALNEAKVLSSMTHPNIISYYDSFEEDGLLMIEMEYADGGNLDQYLSGQGSPVEELQVLRIFQQLASALSYMHEHNVLHRDLKTANVFLTKEGVVKVGDFGISKMLTTRRNGAHTVLGTPYYISPEMCEGKPYDDKSDIWALGCILYEMLCLQKTFDGSNLPALVNKIVKGQFAPIRGNYSPLLKMLVHDILQKQPEYRPTAEEIAQKRLPEILAQFDLYSLDNQGNFDTSEFTFNSGKEEGSKMMTSKSYRSVVYRVRLSSYTGLVLSPMPLPARARVREITASETHAIVITTDLMVYSWGRGSEGQLGHGGKPDWQKKPLCIESLKGKSIVKAGAGEGFSVFVSESGIVMSCGDGKSGCLGHGNFIALPTPKIIESLLSVDINAISCGPEHVVALSNDGDVYAWGSGPSGCLGLEATQQQTSTPTIVNIPRQHNICTIRCGVDGTMLLTELGIVLACGDNRHNRFSLRGGLIPWKDSRNLYWTPTECKSLPGKCVEASMGMNHSVLLTEGGQVVTLGSNALGQRGVGNRGSVSSAATAVPGLNGRTTTSAQCGGNFTLVSTLDNAIYMWGSGESLQSSEVGDNNGASNVTEPLEVLALYASPSQMVKGQVLHFSGLLACADAGWLVVDTTVALAKVPGYTLDPNQSDVPRSFSPRPSSLIFSKSDSKMGSEVPAWLWEDDNHAKVLKKYDV